VMFVGCASHWGTLCDSESGGPEEEELIDTPWKPWTVTLHKFGGSSMSRLENVAGIITNLGAGRLAIVVSALGGVTDALIASLDKAAVGELNQARLDLSGIIERHLDFAHKLLKSSKSFEEIIKKDEQDILNVLRTISLTRLYSTELVELVSGYGEIWSSRLLSEVLHQKHGIQSVWLDARDVLIVRSEEIQNRPVSNSKDSHQTVRIEVEWNESQSRFLEFLQQKAFDRQVLVITGYVCRNASGVPTTLKRNGSDFSASIFGALIKAKEIHIWTDVDGVFSADPRVVPSARKIDLMSYEEAAELAHFGGKVLHPNTMAPAMAYLIPIIIRSSLEPASSGTKIGPFTTGALTCFSVIKNIALIYIDSSLSHGLRLLQRVFVALDAAHIPIILVTQAAFEHSHRFCVHDSHAEAAKSVIEKALFREIHLGEVRSIRIVPDNSLIAAIGDVIASMDGLASRFFSALSSARVNIRVIAQGSADRSLSALVQSCDASKALRAVHDEMTASIVENACSRVFLVGTHDCENLFKNTPRTEVVFLDSLPVGSECKDLVSGSTIIDLSEQLVSFQDYRALLQSGYRVFSGNFSTLSSFSSPEIKSLLKTGLQILWSRLSGSMFFPHIANVFFSTPNVQHALIQWPLSIQFCSELPKLLCSLFGFSSFDFSQDSLRRSLLLCKDSDVKPYLLPGSADSLKLQCLLSSGVPVEMTFPSSPISFLPELAEL